jgi:hypothetical protein
LLAGDARHTDGAGQSRDDLVGDASLFEAAKEFRPLGG